MASLLRYLGTFILLLVFAVAAFLLDREDPHAAETYRLTLPNLAVDTQPPAGAPPPDESPLAKSLLPVQADLPPGWTIELQWEPPETPIDPDAPDEDGATGLATVTLRKSSDEVVGEALVGVFVTPAQAQRIVAESDAGTISGVDELRTNFEALGFTVSSSRVQIPSIGTAYSAWRVHLSGTLPDADLNGTQLEIQIITVVVARDRYVAGVYGGSSDGTNIEDDVIATAQAAYAKLPAK